MKVSWFLYLFSLFTFFVFTETNLLYSPSRAIAESKTTQTRHMVFDLDWTLFSEFDSNLIKPDPRRVFVVEGKSYYLTPYAEELIRFLIEAKIKVSFFSGGGESRNLGLLEKAKLKDGRSFQSIAYQILSRPDLTVMSTDETLSFSERFKKDLTKITDNLDAIVLVEDNKNFALNALQSRNIFWLGPTYQVLTKMEDVELVEPNYLPPTKEAWDLANHKLLIIKEAIREAMYLEESQGISFKEAMYVLQKRLSFDEQKYSPYARNLKNKGLKFLPMEKSRNIQGKSCTDILKPILIK